MNQTTGHVKAETKKPQNQKLDEICPMLLISVAHLIVSNDVRPRKLIYLVAGASDFPHSRQEVFDRGVIKPQKGHILCDAKPRAGGASDANSFETDPLTLANHLRKRSRN